MAQEQRHTADAALKSIAKADRAGQRAAHAFMESELRKALVLVTKLKSALEPFGDLGEALAEEISERGDLAELEIHAPNNGALLCCIEAKAFRCARAALKLAEGK